MDPDSQALEPGLWALLSYRAILYRYVVPILEMGTPRFRKSKKLAPDCTVRTRASQDLNPGLSG